MIQNFFKPIFIFFAGCCFSIILSTTGFSQPNPPAGLLVELLSNPAEAVITDAEPEFGWIVNDTRRGAKQTAYQILVAGSERALNRDRGNVWDSGKVSAGQSINVEYGGEPLKSRTGYYWKVRTWDQDGNASAYSQPQAFYTSDLEYQDRAWPEESRWVELPDGSGQLVLEDRHPMKYHDVKPVEFIRVGTGHYFIDFGKSSFATLKLNLPGSSTGDSIEIHLGDRKLPGPKVNRDPGGTIGYKAASLETEPGKSEYVIQLTRHTPHMPHSQRLAEHMPEVTPFRYAELIGVPGDLAAEDVRQHVLLYQFNEDAAEFTSSDTRLNDIYDLCKHTLKVTPFMGLYTDGNRERMPYEADAYIQQISHYAVDREYAIGRYTYEFLMFHATWPTEWVLHSVLMAHADYMQTGNLENAAEYYDLLNNKTLMALARDDGLISTRTGKVTEELLESVHSQRMRDIVDWPHGRPLDAKAGGAGNPFPEGETDNYDFKEYNTVVNAFHYRNLVLMAELADALGKSEDAKMFSDRAAKVKESFNTEFYRANLDGYEQFQVYVDGNDTRHAALHANFFPVAFGLAEKDFLLQVLQYITSRGMRCGPYGAQYLMDALWDSGESDYAYRLLTSDSDRSWLNMIRMGSTITTEAWDFKYKGNIGWNHAWGASPANIIPRKMFGIEPLEPAFRRMKIKPQLSMLDSASIKVPTIRGSVEARWQQTEHGYTFECTIPANSTAEVSLPVQSGSQLSESGTALADHDYIEQIDESKGYRTFDVPAGKYIFESRLN